jgi:hypothetical protein
MADGKKDSNGHLVVAKGGKQTERWRKRPKAKRAERRRKEERKRRKDRAKPQSFRLWSDSCNLGKRREREREREGVPIGRFPLFSLVFFSQLIIT